MPLKTLPLPSQGRTPVTLVAAAVGGLLVALAPVSAGPLQAGTARVSINPNTPNIPTVNFKVDDDSSVVPVYEAGEGLAFSVSPNPVASDLTVKLPFKSQTSLTISNLQGQTVLAVSTLDPVVQLPVQFLPAGVYLLTARSGEQVLTEKIVRQ